MALKHAKDAKEAAVEAVEELSAKEESIKEDPHAKDEFKKLPASFKDSLEGLNSAQLKEKLADINLQYASNEAALRADQDVRHKRDALSAATEIYRKERAELKLKARYLTRHLSDGGDETAEQVIKNEEAAKTLASM